MGKVGGGRHILKSLQYILFASADGIQPFTTLQD